MVYFTLLSSTRFSDNVARLIIPAQAIRLFPAPKPRVDLKWNLPQPIIWDHLALSGIRLPYFAIRLTGLTRAITLAGELGVTLAVDASYPEEIIRVLS